MTMRADMTLSALFTCVALSFLIGANSPAPPTGFVQAGARTSRPLIIARRGGAHESTENTLGAFQRAVRPGADAIKTDEPSMLPELFKRQPGR
ncbi:MAG TPA: hypothetical protein VNI02_19095 [Blastocatellia bacterium]|nr:hypothetical protein [Blastocatellia bacterium]